MTLKVKFNEIVKQTTKLCNKCYTIAYYLPTEINKSIADYFRSFGEPKYNLDVLNLFQIKTDDDYEIKARLRNNYIYFSMPRYLKGKDMSRTRKPEFDKELIRWLQDILSVEIENG